MTIDFADTQQRGTIAVFGEKERSKETYKGRERRSRHRRCHQDRRVEMRFELDKPDRRECAGRRADDQRARFW